MLVRLARVILPSRRTIRISHVHLLAFSTCHALRPRRDLNFYHIEIVVLSSGRLTPSTLSTLYSFEAQSLQLTFTACSFSVLRLIYIVTFAYPKTRYEVGGIPSSAELPSASIIDASWRTNLQYTLSNKTNVKGYNLYGGGQDSKGTIAPGSEYMTNLSIEYSLTRNWVISTDIHYIHQNKSTFSGNLGVFNPILGLPSSDQFSLAPCLEYNFNQNLGLFIASWFTIAGRNSSKFIRNTFSVYYTF